MFENYGTYLEILELAERLFRASIPYYLSPCIDEGWSLCIYESVGVFFGKRIYTLIVDKHSLGKADGEIEVIEEEGKKKYSMCQDDCFDMIQKWYVDRYKKYVND